MPALPLDDAGPYVAAAYLVFLGLVLVYIAVMAVRLARVEKDIDELARIVEARAAAGTDRTADREKVPAR